MLWLVTESKANVTEQACQGASASIFQPLFFLQGKNTYKNPSR